jgi:hypothetical protein
MALADVPPDTTPTVRVAVGAAIPRQPPGAPPQFQITATGPNAYRIVWTGSDAGSVAAREFRGAIFTSGHFTRVVSGCDDNSCALESNDTVSGPVDVPHGQRIEFDTHTNQYFDGVDVVTDGAPIYLDGSIDGVSHPEAVLYPAADDNNTVTAATSLPIGVTQ